MRDYSYRCQLPWHEVAPGRLKSEWEESRAVCEKGRWRGEMSPGGKTRMLELGSREQLQERCMWERKNTQLWCEIAVFWAHHLQMRTQHGGVKQKHDIFVQESKLMSSQLIIMKGCNTPVKTKERNIPQLIFTLWKSLPQQENRTQICEGGNLLS